MSDWRKEVKKDSPFLYYFDIDGATPLAVEISGAERQDAFCPGKNKAGSLWCLTFKGAKKMLGCNVTNGNLIEHALGEKDPAKWVGRKIILRVAECEGERCIRVHAPGAKLPSQCRRFRYLDNAPAVAAGASTEGSATNG